MKGPKERGRLAQKRGGYGEGEIFKTFEPLVGFRNMRSRRRLEAGNVAVGADAEIDDPIAGINLILQRKNRNHTNVSKAWKEVAGADGKRSDQTPVVWASWRGVEVGGRVLHLAIMTLDDAEQILKAAGWTHGVFRRSFRGRAIPVAGAFIKLRSHASKIGYSIPLMILEYPGITGSLAAVAWETFVEAWDRARKAGDDGTEGRQAEG